MSQPPAYNRTKDFTEDFGSETDHSALNAELDKASNSINDIRTNLAILQADDGKLNPNVITTDSISEDVRNDLSQGILAAVGSSVADAAASAAAAALSETNLADAVTQTTASKNAAAASAADSLANKNATSADAASALNSKNVVVAAETNVASLATDVANNKTATDANAASALANKNASDANAATATTQAGIATTQAGITATQAGIATTKAGEAAASAAAAATFDPALFARKDIAQAIANIFTFAMSPLVPDLSVGDNTQKGANSKLVKESIDANNLARLQITVRQSIQYGPTTGTPAVSDLIPQSQLGRTLAQSVIAKFSTAATLVSIANGFNADGSQNNNNRVLTADLTAPALTASVTNIIAYDYTNNVLVKAIVLDTDTKGGTPAITNGLYTLDYENWKMYLGNGTVANQVQHIILAEVDTNGTVITAIRCRAYRRECLTPQNALPAAGGSVIVNHNIGTNQVDSQVDFVCATASDGYQVGDVHHQIATRNTELVPFNWNFRGKNVAQVTTGTNNLYVINNPANGADANLTPANWRMVGRFKGRY